MFSTKTGKPPIPHETSRRINVGRVARKGRVVLYRLLFLVIAGLSGRGTEDCRTRGDFRGAKLRNCGTSELPKHNNITLLIVIAVTHKVFIIAVFRYYAGLSEGLACAFNYRFYYRSFVFTFRVLKSQAVN